MLRLLASLLLVAGLTACGGATATPVDPEAPAPRVLVAGDSIAEDYYASSADRGFVALVTADLGAEPVEATLSGARSWRITEVVREVTAAEAPVDLAVLEVGANDVGTSSLRQWRTWYANLIAAVEARSPGADIVCLGPWGPPGPTAPYDDVVAELCAGHTFVSLRDLYADPSLRGPAGSASPLGERDSFHPNDAGHQAIADRVLDATART